jgi:hypothetical protein
MSKTNWYVLPVPEVSGAGESLCVRVGTELALATLGNSVRPAAMRDSVAMHVREVDFRLFIVSPKDLWGRATWVPVLGMVASSRWFVPYIVRF